jgi:2-polyprenyl-3-methyl-5-hydroxy-6-metoxy-1,4-benzoquinol methylase
LENNLIFLKQVKKKYRVILYSISTWQKYFWNKRAEQIHKDYGEFTHDFDTIGNLIDIDPPQCLLDFGCGSGRLIPLYLKKNIPSIYCYDISEEALHLARSLFSNHSVHFVSSLSDPLLQEVRFDLVVCSRVLQHIPSSQVVKIIGRLCLLSHRVYINEITKPVNSYFMFQHNYSSIFKSYGFIKNNSGTMQDVTGNIQEWSLFSDARE